MIATSTRRPSSGRSVRSTGDSNNGNSARAASAL
jgi:hypothetical protein